MEPSFISRVQEVFGSLQAGPILDPEAHAPTSFWTISGPQARDHAKQRKGPSDLGLSNGESEEDEDSEEDEEDEDEADGNGRAGKKKRPISCEEFKLGVGGEKEDPEEEFESGKRMIGMDDTLDFEDEEDEFDRVAEGIDLGTNWLHAKDMAPLENLGFVEDVWPTVSKNRTSTPSALKRNTAKRSRPPKSEDSLPALEEVKPRDWEGRTSVEQQEESRDSDGRLPKIPRMSSSMKSVSGGEVSVHAERNSAKHVRFAVAEVAEQQMTAEKTGLEATIPPANARRSSRDRYSTVPDHVKNPSRYTYYSLDWSEEDEDANNRAALKDLQQSKAVTIHQQEEQPAVELPTSLTFIARSKPPNGKEIRVQGPDSDTKMGENQPHPEVLEGKRPVVQVTAHLAEQQAPETGEGEVGMEKLQTSAENTMDKASRRYRNRSKVTSDDSAMEIG